jgi:hypothetical protein
MTVLAWRAIGPDEFMQEIGAAARQGRETKYALQVGLKDLDFEMDEELARAWGVRLPFQSVSHAERALRERAIRPAIFLEEDDTLHQVAAFDPEPVGLSGFMGCVTHSLALTDRGLFEVGRYSALSLSGENHSWQWFLHRRLAMPEQVHAWIEEDRLTERQVVERCFKAMTGRSR